MGEDTLTRLAVTIAQRRNATGDTSYTKSLIDKGPAACAKKLGEEAVETVIAAASESDERVVSETADLLYHTLVLLEARNISLQRVFEELARRAAQSGIAEKASRQADGASQ